MTFGEKADHLPTSSQDTVEFSISHESLYFKDCLIWLYLSMGNKLPTIPGESHIVVKEIIQRAAKKKKRRRRKREWVQGKEGKIISAAIELRCHRNPGDTATPILFLPLSYQGKWTGYIFLRGPTCMNIIIPITTSQRVMHPWCVYDIIHYCHGRYNY